MFEDVAVIHPVPGAIVGIPRDPHRRFRANIDDILQRAEGRLLAVDLEDLEEESVQMEWMIHHRLIDDVPHLQLADLDRLAVMVALAVDDEVESTPKAHLETEFHRSRDAGVRRVEWRNLAQARRHARGSWLS